RQAGVRDAEVARQVRVTPRIGVEGRRRRIPEHAGRLLVLEHHYDDMLELGRGSRGGRRRTHEQRTEESEAEGCLHVSSARRRRHTCSAPITRTTSTPMAMPPYTP